MAFDANTGKVLWEHKFNVFLVRHRLQPRRLDEPRRRPDHASDLRPRHAGLPDVPGRRHRQARLAAIADRGVRPGDRLRRPERQPDRRRRPGHHRHASTPAGATRAAAATATSPSTRTPARSSGGPSRPTAIKGTYYSNPIVKEVNGQRLLITGLADGELAAMQVRTGVKVWGYQFGANVINASPVMEGTYVYCTSRRGEPGRGREGPGDLRGRGAGRRTASRSWSGR